MTLRRIVDLDRGVVVMDEDEYVSFLSRDGELSRRLLSD